MTKEQVKGAPDYDADRHHKDERATTRRSASITNPTPGPTHPITG